MADVGLDEMLYYQYMINHNSASTMLSAISGTSAVDDSTLSLGSLGGLGQIDTSGSFYQVLQRYLGDSTQGISTSDALEAADMLDQLKEAMTDAEEAGETETKSYQTVQEIYEYFSNQVSARASALLGGVSGASSGNRSGSDTGSNSGGALEHDISSMNQAALRGVEFDFEEVDTMIDAAFSERIPSIS